ncbi:MAG: hypothetical protein ACRDHP_05815 [Ktedonobacterales bacterium]
MTNPTQSDYPDDSDTGASRRDQLGQEMAGPQDQTGLAGSANSPDNSGLAGTPNSPDNSGLAGSSGAPVSDQGLEGGGTSYGNDTDYTGVSGSGVGTDTSFTGDYGTSVGGPGLSGQTRTPESELLDPGYNPQVGDAGRLDDLNRVGQPGAPNDNPDQPTPSGYSGTADNPGIPDQAGTQDQTMYTNQSGATSGQGDGSANTNPNQSGS